MTQHSPARDRASGAAVQDTAQEVVSQAQEKAQDVAARGNDRLRHEVDRRSTELGEQAQTLAHALRKSASELDQNGPGGAASVAHGLADRVDSLGGYLKDADADRLLGSIEDMARRRPWVAGGAAAVIGFAASRFLKASSGNRYDSTRHDELLLARDAEAPLYREREETLVRPRGRGGL